MRNVLNNNNGYVLALVLIISILITVIFFSFLAISSNTTKQHNIVESTFQSQSIAEMGASYFQHAMTNEIITKQENIIKKIIDQRNEDIKAKQLQDDQHYIGLAIKDMEEVLTDIVLSLKKSDDKEDDPEEKTIKMKVHSNPKNSFEVTPVTFSRADDALIINFTSIGHDEAKNAEIKGTISVDFSNMIDPTTNNESDESIITGNTIADPGTSLNICPTGTRADLSNKQCQIKGNITYSQNDELKFNNSIYRVSGTLTVPNMNYPSANSTLYIVGSMNGQNLNSMTNVKLHVGGALFVNQFNGRIVDSVIEVAGSTTLYGNLDNLNNSTMYIGGSFMMGQINQISNSTIYVQGSANIYQGVNLGRNANICVNGDLAIGNINDNSGGTSKIYARTSSSTHKSVIVGNDTFEAACAGGSPTVSPGSIDYTTEYEYSY
ncbi:hypothetical protein BFM98_09275 [Lysinibacillus sp. AR18-8]|uniref:hypothetical protein n=1 Tax=Lysinibacillus sp. AR18-8 TaxID=1889781 RepID=UPI00082675DF|nr:hypothetical protein [Lysinibacillus sp. AR18-8]OCX64277.1 hypothetical protein BFM98_09275 [Lysinibacillus sp. AR18-8]